MASIFISYCREDSAGHAGRLCDRLSHRLGDDRVFMDVQDLQPGQNFPQSIEDTIARSECMVAVIGPRWLELLRSRGAEEDFVRREIAAALSRGIIVVPVLVGNARMPSARDMPIDLSALGDRQAFEIRDDRFDDDVTRLVEHLRLSSSSSRSTPPNWLRTPRVGLALAAVLLVAASVAFFATREAAPRIDGVWLAQMRKVERPPYNVRLHFVLAGDKVMGQVDYPTGSGTIEGEIRGRRLSFRTVHVPAFERSPATILFQGEVAGDEIRLTSTDSAGVATGVARRTK